MAADTKLFTFQHQSHHGLSEFIAPLEKRSVPNYLLDTKIYAGSDNDVFQCRPPAINFQGFVSGHKYTQKLRIINVSSECQQMHLIPPPSSDTFKVKYTKTDSLVPGMYLDVTVEFYPRENVFHDDCIRIHCKGSGSNLIVPIYAYLLMDISTFPSTIHFKPTQVGQSAVKRIPLKNDAAIDFNFQIIFTQRHPAFDVIPLSGVIPGNGKVNVSISFSPREYCTASGNFQILISQFNSKPYNCYITGTSEPGLATKAKLKNGDKVAKYTSTQPQHPTRTLVMKNRKLDQAMLPKDEDEGKKENIKDGVLFPTNIHGHSAVASVLSQKAGKLKVNQLKQVIGKGDNSDHHSKQMKMAVFERNMIKNVEEEERNQLRWGVKLGDLPSDVEDENAVDAEEGTGTKSAQSTVSNGTVFKRDLTLGSNHRICTNGGESNHLKPSFDIFLNNDWEKRHMTMARFIQAARKVILFSRATKSLNAMNCFLREWRSGNTGNSGKASNENNIEAQLVDSASIEIVGTKLFPFSFPESKEEEDTAVDALGVVTPSETVLVSKHNIGLYDLEVPLYFKLNYYNPHPHTSGVNTYVPKKYARKLKTGLEKDIVPVTPTEAEQSDFGKSASVSFTEIISVPTYLLQEPQYHPLHIFNPMPGVMAHAEKLPYSEIDDDYSLTPLYHANTTKGLNREDIIPGVMHWKKFPSHALVAMSQPSLFDVYVPRWGDPFSEELTPKGTPGLLKCLPEEDQCCDDVDNDDTTVPNMEMICAEFGLGVDGGVCDEDCGNNRVQVGVPLPATNNPQSKTGMISRKRMKAELNGFLHSEMNELGSRIKARVLQCRGKWDLF